MKSPPFASRKRASPSTSSGEEEVGNFRQPEYVALNLKSAESTGRRIRTLSAAHYFNSMNGSFSHHLESEMMEKKRSCLRDTLFSPKVLNAIKPSPEVTRGAVGLLNLGNTCYMNSAVQALSHCPPLRNYFCVLSEDIRPSDENTTAISTSPTAPLVGTNVSSAFRDLLNRLWSERPTNAVRPTVFLFQVRNKCAQFRGFGQQDAQEFIRCFLDVLHQELKYPIDDKHKTLMSPSTLSTSSSAGDDHSEGNDAPDSGMSTENESVHQKLSGDSSEADASASFSKKDLSNGDLQIAQPPPKQTYESLVSVIFDGQLVSTVKCLTCQHLSHTTETFQDISLSIPSQEQVDKMKEAMEEIDPSAMPDPDNPNFEAHYGSWIAGIANRWFVQPWFSWLMNFYRYVFSGSISLNDCLRAFFASDHLREENMYKCEKCDKLRNGVKQCQIKSLPEILCIHLKRFRHDHMYNTKINTKITFPLRDLDLGPYMTAEEDEVPEITTYDLISVVSHRGSSVDFGHYVAYCWNQLEETWYEFDDSYVRAVNEAEVQTAEAYVLFYQRRSMSSLLDEVDDF